MKTIWKKVPTHVTILLKQLGIVLFMLYLTRVIFYLFNLAELAQVSGYDFFIALWFDAITIGLFFLPYYLLFLLPIPYRNTRPYRIFFSVLFHLTNALLIGLNLLDVEYFKYTSKRSTFDLFTILGAGSDFKQLATTFMKDFWFLLLLFVVLVAVSIYLYKKTWSKIGNKSNNFYLVNTLSFLILAPVFFIIGRGGFDLKPTGIIEASRYVKPENLAFVLTTPFTMVKTIDQEGVKQINYFSEEECLRHFDPIKKSSPQHILPDGTNVVIILLESFGTEFIGAYNPPGFTPFFDSLIEQSLAFEYAFSNGKKSIEAVPAVLASIPTLMENPYISSPYGDNQLQALPTILKKYGYESAFYHGATNGSMRFDGFSKICGFDHYVGRYEYNNDAHFDKTWGILDEYFNPWTAQQISQLKQPFFATLFTLSSHHPYFIPEHMRDKIKYGPQPICGSINYGDYALARFFEEAQQQPWYDNTLFVILADHSPSTTTPEYKTRTHLYRIPIVFFDPKGRIQPEKSKEIFQQLDIMPTLLDLLNIDTRYYGFGNSYYDSIDREAIAYLSGTFHYFRDDFMISISSGKARNLYDFTVPTKTPLDSLSHYTDKAETYVQRVNAMHQRYNLDLIMNQTTTNEKKNTLHN